MRIRAKGAYENEFHNENDRKANRRLETDNDSHVVCNCFRADVSGIFGTYYAAFY